MNTNKSKDMVKLAFTAMDDKKAENIKIIDISEVTAIADYFIICSGSNPSQIDAIVDNIQETLGREGFYVKRIEGNRSSGWILMDFGDIVVHIFSRDDRLFYDLERIWRDGRSVDISEI